MLLSSIYAIVRSLFRYIFIMGRSSNSRNRIFEVNDRGGIRTKAFDESKMTDPSLIIMHPFAVKTISAKKRDKAWMNIYNSVSVFAYKLLSQNGKEACKNNQINIFISKHIKNSLIIFSLRAI